MTTKYETFAMEQEANARISKMMGWDGPQGDGPQAVQFVLPDDPNADDDGNVWVIEAAPNQYVRTDGFIN